MIVLECLYQIIYYINMNKFVKSSIASFCLSTSFCFSTPKLTTVSEIAHPSNKAAMMCDTFKTEIESRFESFVEQHNMHSDDKISVDKIDNIYDVFDADGNHLYYVDFFECGGGMVVDERWNVYCLRTRGQYNELKDFDGQIFFDKDDGILFGKANGNTVCFQNYDDEDKMSFECSSPIVNSGTDSSGHIFDVDAYVSAAHSDYSYENAFYLVGNYYKSSQFNTSVFYKYSYNSSNVVTGLDSEGNCTLNATYSSMLNAARHGWNANVLNLGTTTFNSTTILSDRLISTCGPYGTNVYRTENNVTKIIPINQYRWGIKPDYYFNNSFDIPTLYWHIRERAIDLSYVCDSFSTGGNNVQDLYRHAYHQAGYNYPTVLNDGSACDNVIFNIKNNSIPGMVCTYGSTVYGNHSMSVYGYKTYSVTKQILWFTEKYYKYLFLVDDGHTDTGFLPVSDSAILSGNLLNNPNYTTQQKQKVRWYDHTCATSNVYYSIFSSTMEHTL